MKLTMLGTGMHSLQSATIPALSWKTADGCLWWMAAVATRSFIRSNMQDTVGYHMNPIMQLPVRCTVLSVSKKPVKWTAKN